MLSAKSIATILAVAAVVALIVGCARRFTLNTDGGLVTLGDFPQLLSALSTTGGNGSFWVVLVPNTARDDGNYANLQYSIEGGRVGMDWVLLAKRNVEDKEAFTQFVTAAGATVTERVGNDVHYLRVSDRPDLAKLGQDFLQHFYHVGQEDKLQLIITDFELKPKTATKNI
ncbi:MAG: hypothetical protein H0W34_14580 [Pyrinomonadaceae bacterium]|jgi:hypothetical protein|nr:hypothetical protein [Pyrinomonadaceae bacterium]